jgi:UDP-glucose 6-dehydrogenase
MCTAVVRYVGPESGPCLAHFGHELTYTDSDAVLGLTSKLDTNDLRDAPFLPPGTALSDTAVTLRAYDPAGVGGAKQIAPHLTALPGLQFDVGDCDPR